MKLIQEEPPESLNPSGFGVPLHLRPAPAGGGFGSFGSPSGELHVAGPLLSGAASQVPNKELPGEESETDHEGKRTGEAGKPALG